MTEQTYTFGKTGNLISSGSWEHGFLEDLETAVALAKDHYRDQRDS